MLPLQYRCPRQELLALENDEGEQQTCGAQKCRTCGTDMTQCLTKKVPRGSEPRSLDSESRVLTVTPRDQLIEAFTCFQIGLQLPLLFPARSQIDHEASCLHLCSTSLAGWTGLSQCFLKICALRCRLEKKGASGYEEALKLHA